MGQNIEAGRQAGRHAGRQAENQAGRQAGIMEMGDHKKQVAEGNRTNKNPGPDQRILMSFKHLYVLACCV